MRFSVKISSLFLDCFDVVVVLRANRLPFGGCTSRSNSPTPPLPRRVLGVGEYTTRLRGRVHSFCVCVCCCICVSRSRSVARDGSLFARFAPCFLLLVLPHRGGGCMVRVDWTLCPKDNSATPSSRSSIVRIISQPTTVARQRTAVFVLSTCCEESFCRALLLFSP